MSTEKTPLSATAPKFDVDALMSLHRGNFETFVAVQKVWLDLAQTITRKNADLFRDYVGRAEGLAKGYDSQKQPQSYVDDMKAAVEKAVAEVKENVDLGMKAQSEVVDLVVKRANANIEGVKGLAA